MQVVAPPIDRPAVARAGLRISVVVALAHGLTDMYASFVPPLLPRIMDDLQISIALAATLAVSYSIAGALPQPAFGYFADRTGRRLFAVLGPLTAGVSVASIAFAGSFRTLLVLLLIGGMGSAAFHPAGASLAVRVAEGKGGGKRYSLFAFGGAAGFAIGPLAAVSIVRWQGMDGLWIAMLPVCLLAPLVMGLAWAVGSLGVLATGAAADAIGPYAATLLSMPAILVAVGLALHPALERASRHAHAAAYVRV